MSIFRPIIYGNTAVALTQKERDALPSPDHTHRWTVAVRSAASPPNSDQVGGADDLSYFIKRVTFKLHDTYPSPTRSEGTSLSNPFKLLSWQNEPLKRYPDFIDREAEIEVVDCWLRCTCAHISAGMWQFQNA